TVPPMDELIDCASDSPAIKAQFNSNIAVMKSRIVIIPPKRTRQSAEYMAGGGTFPLNFAIGWIYRMRCIFSSCCALSRLRLASLFTFVLLVGCAKTGYRFQQVDKDPPVELPLKLTGFYGVRDGSIVTAEAHFTDGSDRVTMNIVLFLRPPAEFRSGTYEASVGGRMIVGAVECPSLTFQGGQTALPVVGGLFTLKDENSRPLYRVNIPAMPLTGRPKQ